MKTACITGVTGQTGSYLAELLLEKGYKVYGLIRRASTFNTGRIDHLIGNHKFDLVFGDLSDQLSLIKFIDKAKPDLFFNLGAQSHVRVSFDIPEYTFDIDATGVIRCLEALRLNSPHTHFLQASSSELFGSTPPPQNENTPFHPRSPYGAAKIAAYWATVNYREAYNMFACNSISFNHECITANTPIIIRRNNIIEVCSSESLIPRHRKNKQTFEFNNVQIWDGDGWADLKSITLTIKNNKDKNHIIKSVEARCGIVEATNHHNFYDPNFKKIKVKNLNDLDKLAIAEIFPENTGWTIMSPELAEFLGLLVAEGCALNGKLQFTNTDYELIKYVDKLWRALFLGSSRIDIEKSGFNPENNIFQLYMSGNPFIVKWIKEQIYTKNTKYKCVPPLILNSNAYIQNAFIKGYYEGDGLKAGNGDSIKTNSAFLAQGLVLLYGFQGRKSSVYAEHREDKVYYQLNILKNTKIGRHWVKEPSEIRKIVESQRSADENKWIFDIETSSGKFNAGIGRIIIANSPRRGETFVTRKITRAATRIKLGLQDKLILGNLDAKRDWSHARDVANGMYMIITAQKADDFVIASEESHSVQKFCEMVFNNLGLNYKDHVMFDPKYLRPSEVDHLQGDASKIKNALGWKPNWSFEDLVDEMIEEDMILAEREKLLLEKS